MSDYKMAMERAVLYFKSMGVTHFIFGAVNLYGVKSIRK